MRRDQLTRIAVRTLVKFAQAQSGQRRRIPAAQPLRRLPQPPKPQSFARKYAEFVKLSHTVFALPFALASMVVAARARQGWPGWRVFLLVLACMVTARTCAMVFNRIVDRHFDKANPRTAMRHLPTGQISLAGAWALWAGSAAGFVAATWFLNPVCFYLSPVALVVVCF